MIYVGKTEKIFTATFVLSIFGPTYLWIKQRQPTRIYDRLTGVGKAVYVFLSA